MYTKITSQEPLQIVSLAEAKRQLNIIDNTDDDTYIQLLIDACSELAEGYTKRMLSEGVVDLIISGRQSFFLPYGEATESTTAIVATVAGDPITFEFEPISQVFTIDDNQISYSDKVKLTYHAGYKEIPSSVKMGVLMMISSLFENREDIVVGFTVADIPLNSMAILNKVKIENI